MMDTIRLKAPVHRNLADSREDAMKGCRSCRNWTEIDEFLDRDDPAAVGAKVQMGTCRRHAPQPATVTAGANEARVEGRWPLVASDAWCGDWEPGFES